MKQNVLILMCDQFRFDCIGALGNEVLRTPNLDRIRRRGVAFSRAYSTCPICIPARYTIRTGRSPLSTGITTNLVPDGAKDNFGGAYLAQEMRDLGYRTFGIGKFHTVPHDEELGYDVHIHTEELYEPGCEMDDDYYRYVRSHHPEFNFVEQLHGERSEMYYQPQVSPLPAHLTVESWVADRAIEQLRTPDDRPYFGFVSFIGPHPPFAPPVPYNRMYSPDVMPDPVRGDITTDLLDEYLGFMNHLTFAGDVSDLHTKILRSRYYGEITYIDGCIGRILDEIESRGDADRTMICFLSDHGEHFGDHHAWQKESFFESSCRIPLLLSLPGAIEPNSTCSALVCLEDIFATVTACGGSLSERDGRSLFDIVEGHNRRDRIIGLNTYGRHFRTMVFDGRYKMIYMSNGAAVQLFDVLSDPDELRDISRNSPTVVSALKRDLTQALSRASFSDRYLRNGQLIGEPRESLSRSRLLQMPTWHGANDYTYR